MVQKKNTQVENLGAPSRGGFLREEEGDGGVGHGKGDAGSKIVNVIIGGVLWLYGKVKKLWSRGGHRAFYLKSRRKGKEEKTDVMCMGINAGGVGNGRKKKRCYQEEHRREGFA